MSADKIQTGDGHAIGGLGDGRKAAKPPVRTLQLNGSDVAVFVGKIFVAVEFGIARSRSRSANHASEVIAHLFVASGEDGPGVPQWSGIRGVATDIGKRTTNQDVTIGLNSECAHKIGRFETV